MKLSKILSKQTMVAGFIIMLAASFGISFSNAPLASATTHCSGVAVCIWDGTSYSGSTQRTLVPSSGTVCATLPTWAKNMMSSYANATNRSILWYDGDGCTGTFLVSGGALSEYSSVPSGANNKANSFKLQ